MQPPGPQKTSVPGVRHLLAVASGKGGVGKSTTAVNLALALQARGLRVGLMDADIYGPSVPTMLGVGRVDPQTTAFPLTRYGLQVMSIGFLPDADKGVLLRGPMVARYITAFLQQISWGDLDVLVIDMPPGTGDAQLSLCQSVNVTGAVIVTTPQDVSLMDARKALNMFRELRVPVLGVVENMSYFVGEDGKRYDLFGSGGGRKLSAESGVPLLGGVPIDPRVAACGDGGVPVVQQHPESPVAQAYMGLAATLAQALSVSSAEALPEVEL